MRLAVGAGDIPGAGGRSFDPDVFPVFAIASGAVDGMGSGGAGSTWSVIASNVGGLASGASTTDGATLGRLAPARA